MPESTESLGKEAPRAQHDVSEAETATAEGTIANTPSAPSTTYDNKVPDFFKPGHIVQIPLHTLQDVMRAKVWIQQVRFQTHPVLSDLEFSFRALYDGVDGTTVIRVTRFVHQHESQADPKTELAAYLRLHSHDSRIPARTLNMYDEVTKNGGDWIARHWSDESQNLRVGGHIWFRYYNFFKDMALRKEGKDWNGADLECVVDFLADLRGR